MNIPAISVPNTKSTGAEVSKALSVATPVLGIVVSLVVAFFVVWPKINEVMALRRANEELKVKADKLEVKVSKLKSLSKPDLEKQLSLADRLLPSDKGVFTFLTQVELVKGTSGVIVDKLDVNTQTVNTTSAPGTPEAVKSATSSLAPNVEVSLSTTSGYESLLQFLNTLYQGSRVVTVDDLSLSAVENGVLKGSMTVLAYWQPLPTDLGSVESEIKELTAIEKERLVKVETSSQNIPAVIPIVPVGKSDLFSGFAP